MMMRLILIISVLLIISSSCKEPHPVTEVEIKNKTYPLELIKEREVKIDGLGYPGFVPLYNSDNIMISLEYKDKELLTFDSELKLLERNRIKYGEGPNECLLPVVMGVSKEGFLVFDVTRLRYFLYDRELRSRKNISAEQRGWIPHGVNFSFTHETILSCYRTIVDSAWTTYDFHVYLRKLKGTRLENTEIFTFRFKFFLENNVSIIGNPIHFRMIDDYVYILKKIDYRILKVDLEGNVVKEIRVPNFKKVRFSRRQRGDWLEATGSKLKRSQSIFPEYLWPANFIMELAGGIAVGRMEDYNPVKKDWIEADYFDKNLNFLGKIKLPWFYYWNYPGHFQSDFSFYSKGDKLYLIERRDTDDDEEYWLTRWKIKK